MKNLQPNSVWSHFATLCAIPRPSLKEAALRNHLIAWSESLGIEANVDSAGNLILRKPGTSGCDSRPGVIIQGHLDMVCQANSGIRHDFSRDPISAVERDGWLVAENTTLGADNGIGVALALAVLEEDNLPHPPLEVLLTVNEECGMDGARGLKPDSLTGKTLINLDSEEWGHFYVGCAGGVDVQVRHECSLESVPSDYALVRLDVKGLRGGHSGIDIHLGRGNAIKLLAEALHDLSSHTDVRLIALSGGTARNAIPREASALCALPENIASGIDQWVRHRHQALQSRFLTADMNVSFDCAHYDAAPVNAIGREDRDRLLAFLDTVANGVARVNDHFPGVTDTSSNLGVASLEQGHFIATFKVRSLLNERKVELADKIVSRAKGYGLDAWQAGEYPGWTPNPSSQILLLCQQVYAEQFGQTASLQVIHAGLECGLLSASHPHLDMISFGPNIRGAHAPGEAVEIVSVARCWTLLKAILRAMANA